MPARCQAQKPKRLRSGSLTQSDYSPIAQRTSAKSYTGLANRQPKRLALARFSTARDSGESEFRDWLKQLCWRRERIWPKPGADRIISLWAPGPA